MDRADEGTNSVTAGDRPRQHVDNDECMRKTRTLDRDHEVAKLHLNSFWLKQEPVVRLVDLWVPTLHRVQCGFRAQGLRKTT